MLSCQRVLHASTDISAKVNDYRALNYTFAYTSGQYLYVGSEVPFNNLWFDLSSNVNAAAAAASVDLWWSNAWTAAVDVFDETKVGSASLGQSGRISWSPSLTSGWDREQDSADVTGLSGTAIYYFYWARFSWSASLTGTTELKYLGQKFAGDSELESFYPDLANSDLKTSFEAGKTTWDEQHFMAAEAIARDLIARKLIASRGAILDWARLTEAACHKAAEIVYRGLGVAYEPHRLGAARDYAKAMNGDFFRVDLNADGRLDPSEKNVSVSYLSR